MRHRNFIIAIYAIAVVVICGLVSTNAFARGRFYAPARQMTAMQKQIYIHSVAANKHRNWVANRANRQLYRYEKYKNGFGNYYLYYPRHYRRYYQHYYRIW